MTVKDDKDGELVCRDFSEFTKLWKVENSTLRAWFHTISTAIDALVDPEAYSTRNPTALVDREAYSTRNSTDTLQTRIRHLQHVLLDLVNLLDGGRLSWDVLSMEPLRPGTNCPCSGCTGSGRVSRRGPV
jgi:hypothetical protein